MYSMTILSNTYEPIINNNDSPVLLNYNTINVGKKVHDKFINDDCSVFFKKVAFRLKRVLVIKR